MGHLVEIRPATVRDVSYIAAHLREADKEELECQWSHYDPVHLAYLIETQSITGMSWVAYRHDQPVGALGFSYASGLDPDIWQAWAFGTDGFLKVIPELTRLGNEVALPMILEGTVRRIQAFTLKGHDVAHKWLEAFGARYEGTLRAWGRNGEDFDVYAWVRD